RLRTPTCIAPAGDTPRGYPPRRLDLGAAEEWAVPVPLVFEYAGPGRSNGAVVGRPARLALEPPFRPAPRTAWTQDSLFGLRTGSRAVRAVSPGRLYDLSVPVRRVRLSGIG